MENLRWLSTHTSCSTDDEIANVVALLLKQCDSFANEKSSWEYVMQGLGGATTPRVKRAMVMLLRNMTVVCHQHLIPLYPQVLEMAMDVPEMYEMTLQMMYNFTSLYKECPSSQILLVLRFLNHNPGSLAWVMLVDNYFSSDDFIYYALKRDEESVKFVTALYDNYEHNTDDLTPYQLKMVSCWLKLLLNESMGKFTMTYPSMQRDIVSLAHVLLTSKENYKEDELTVVCSFLWDLFKHGNEQIKHFFATGNGDPKEIGYITLTTLETLALFGQYARVREFLVSYKGVELLVELLGLLHKNVSKINTNKGEIVKDSSFPGIKSAIIENLSFLTFQNFEVQEKMRQVHGLELVLSNCIIDDNEPFIKERSIICLRFLLLNNAKNQEFITQMEAREAVQDDALQEAGYEVKIVDGKVKLQSNGKKLPGEPDSKKPKLQEIQEEEEFM